MDFMNIMKMLDNAGGFMGGAGNMMGAMRGGQPMGQNMFPSPTALGQKPPMQMPQMQNQIAGRNPMMNQTMNPMMQNRNMFSSALGRYGGLM